MQTNMQVERMFGLLKFILLMHQTNANYFIPVPLPNQMDFPLNFSSSNNILCKSNSALFVRSLNNYTLWAYRMWDASAKFPIGLTEGNQYQLGHFDECISIQQPFKTQYCLATIYIKIKLNKNISDPFSLEYKPNSLLFDKLYYSHDPNKVRREKIFWGFCVPFSCKAKDVQIELEQYLNKEKSNSEYIHGYSVEIRDTDCQTQTKWFDFDIADYSFCGLILCLFFIIVICTLIDAYYVSKSSNENIRKKNSIKYVLCFSAKENFNDLNKVESTNEALQIIYGLRVFMTCSIVMGHSFTNLLAGSLYSVEDIEQKNRSLEYIFVCRGELIVDIFFVISGLLNTYSYLVQSEKKTVNPIRIVLLRYTRFAPVFAIITYFYATIFYKLGSGPLWDKIIGKEREYCLNNWWTNLLFVNNYINSENLCILQGWFLAADLQLALLAIPLNMLMRSNTKFKWIILSIVLIISMIIPFLIVYYEEMEPLLFVFNDYLMRVRKNDFFRILYIPMHTRASTFIIGMILGYVYYRLKDSKFQLSLIPSIWLFNIGTLIAASCFFSGLIFYNPYISYLPINNASFAAFNRPGFALGGGLMLFVGSFGKLPVLKRFFCWKGWVPIAKLSFSVYMVHWAFQLAHSGAQRTPMNLNAFYWISQTIVEIVLSHILALFLFIAVENPFSKLMKHLLPSDSLNCKTRCESTDKIL